MTQHERASGNVVWSVWGEERQDARENAMSVEEFGPHQRDAYDLDDADIDGRENPQTYTRFDDTTAWWKTTDETESWDIRDRKDR